MGFVPPAPPPARPTLWKCSCEGCGAPTQRHDLQCSFCLRPTGADVPMVEVTTLEDTRPRFVAAGLMTPNEARGLLGVRPFVRQPDDEWR